MNRITPENITNINKLTEVFVFGSNEAGKHGKGAAKIARDNFEAIYGQGFGPMGSTFGIPTKDWNIQTLNLDIISFYVESFIRYAKIFPQLRFYVTKIGCGLAGHNPIDIAMFFKDCIDLNNVYLPIEFWKQLNKHYIIPKDILQE